MRQSARGTGLYGGVRRNRNTIRQAAAESASSEEVIDEPSEGALEESGQRLTRVRGQARGYNMLYLMHPRARDTVNAQVEALRVAELQEQYLSVLTDGTFAKDFNFLNSVIRKLNEDGKTLTLILFLTNGATMRRFDSTPITAGFNRIDPEDFRDLIRFDSNTRERFKSMVREVKPSFDLNKSLNPNNRNIAIAMLEDNLKRDSYVTMREMAKEILGNEVEYMRNPCVGCHPGNDGDSDGDPVEYHNPFQIAQMSTRDGFTNDGMTYLFVNEPDFGDSIRLEDLKSFQKNSLARNIRYFGLWRVERQGLRPDTRARQHPDQRDYEVPTVEQLLEEIRFLRDGLQEVAG